VVTYQDLAPILQTRCAICHQGEGAPLGLRLDSLEALLAGSRNGPVVKAGDPAGSELIRRLTGTSQPRMPMTGPPFLADADIARFERWISAGLPGGPAVAVAGDGSAAPRRPGPGEAVTYLHVAPILATRCAKCHAERGLVGPAPEGYRLTSYEATLSADDRARVVPGHPDASELVRRVRGQALPRMPFDGPPYLADDDVALIVEWVRQGARDAEGRPAPLPVGAEVRLHGSLDGRWTLDGLSLATSRDLRLDKSPSPGDYVEVRGRVGRDGTIVAERIRGR
jgi:mono/diheme cytochrome c family protein